MKKIFVLSLALVMVLSLVVVAAASDYQMSISYGGATGSEEDISAKQYKEWIEERTDGKIEVKLFGNEQLGKEVDVVTSLELGTVDMAIMGTTVHQQAAPKYNIWSAYYIFNSPEEVMYVLNGPIGQEVKEAMLNNKGIRIIGYGLRGPRNLTTNYPVEKPEDVKGLDIRVPLQPIYVASWKTLGAQPQTIAYGELYTALKQGIVEAQENPLAYIYAPAFYEVQDYVNLTQHQRAFFTYVVSEKFFQRLTPELQEVIVETGKDITEFHNNLQQEKEAEWRTKLEEEGMTFVEADREAFKEALSDIPNQFADQWVPNLYQRIQDEIAKFHAQGN